MSYLNTHFVTFQVSKLLIHLELKTHLHFQFFGGVNGQMWKWFPMLRKKTFHMFSVTPLLTKTCPLSGRVVPCSKKRGMERG